MQDASLLLGARRRVLVDISALSRSLVCARLQSPPVVVGIAVV
jgi:hypothetical protein